MRTFLLLTICCIYCSCHAQDSIHCTRHYDFSGPSTSIDSFFFSIPNRLTISFNCSFDDSVIISINGHVIQRSYMLTNHSIDLAGTADISFKDSTDCKIMKVYFVKAGKYLAEKLDFRFKALDIWTNRIGPWELDYSNHFPLRE